MDTDEPSTPTPPRPALGRGPGRHGAARVAGSFTAINLVIAATTLITGPVQARALGPGGRGDLAAIIVPLAFAFGLANVGLTTYVLREVARGRPARDVLGGIAPLALAIGCAIALAGPLIASFIASGRGTVRLFLVIGFVLMPVTLLLNLLSAVNWARERWTIVAVVRLIPPAGTLVAVLVLYATDHLTVAAMASITIALGLLAGLPLLVNLRGLGRPRWSRAVAAEGLSFGSRAWLGTLAALANAQVDQVIMTRAVSPAELGFYAVAVNVTTIPQSLSGAVVGVLMPRVAAGDAAFTARATRIVLAVVAVTSLALVAVVGIALPLLFGSEFEDSVSMARILLAGSVPLAGGTILVAGLVASGRPGASAVAQAIGLVVTFPALALLLGPLGGDGAALASLAAYCATFACLLVQAVRHLGGRASVYLLPQRGDWRFLRGLPLLQRLRRKLKRETGN